MPLIECRPYDWEKLDVQCGRHQKSIYLVHALAKDNSKVMLRVEDFKPRCVVQLPETYVSGKRIAWDVSLAEDIRNKIASNVRTLSDGSLDAFADADFFRRQTLYHWRPPLREGEHSLPDAEKVRRVRPRIENREVYKSPMLQLRFISETKLHFSKKAIRNFSYKDGKEEIRGFGVWETEVGTIVKMHAKAGICHNSWIRVQANSPQRKMSTLEGEFLVRAQDIKPIAEEECKLWQTYPGKLGFDIETWSHSHLQFPNKDDPAHVAYMVSCCYEKDGDPVENRVRYAVILGDSKHIPDEKLANKTIIKVSTEKELVDEFVRIVAHHDPEVILSYNGLSFDYDYLNARVRKIFFSEWKNMGRLLHYPTKIGEQKQWASNAYGSVSTNEIFNPGRIDIDMLQYVKREFKLPQYKLDIVANKFLGVGKNDMPIKRMFAIYKEFKDSSDKLTAEFPVGSPAKDIYPEVSKPDILAKLSDTQTQAVSRYSTALDDLTLVTLYCMQDTELCLDLFNYFNLWVASIEMSNVARVSIEELYTRGQQVRCVNKLYCECFLRGIVVDHEEARDIPFTGGAVAENKPGLHTEPVCTIDFASLYPTIIQEYNLCYTTNVRDCDLMYITPEMVHSAEVDCNQKINAEKDAFKKQTYISNAPLGMYKFRFFKEEYYKGVLPTIIGDLLVARKRVQGMMKEPGLSPAVRKVLDKRQLALKVTANSMYGFLGVRAGGKKPLLEAAICTTYWGRDAIGRVNDLLKGKYSARVIYGDTDSCMVIWPGITDPKEAWDKTEEVCQEITDSFRKYVNIKPEDVSVMLSITKKRYVKWVYDAKTWNLPFKNGDPLLMIKGLMPARRDNCPWAKIVYMKLLNMIMLQKPYSLVVTALMDCVIEMQEGKVDHNNFVVTCKLGGSYKGDNDKMQLFSARIRAEGQDVKPGDRIPYLVMKADAKEKLGNKMILLDTYENLLEEGNAPELDKAYYLEKVLTNHSDQLLAISYKSIIDEITLDYTRNSRCRKLLQADSVTLIASQKIAAGQDLREFKRDILQRARRAELARAFRGITL